MASPAASAYTATYLTPAQLDADLTIPDLSDPASGPHAIQLLVQRAVDALHVAWGSEPRWWRGTRVVGVADNYDRLGFARGSVTRDARYTRYVDTENMLRSHSSAMVPEALRALAADPGLEDLEDVLLVCPGIVFRRDCIDWQHTGTPHQLDLWRITRSPMGDGDLDEMIRLLLSALVPGLASRGEARSHPYTEHGRQVDVIAGERSVEVWECGLAAPRVLSEAGLGPEWDGLALGMGLDRLLMLVKEIPDIRLLRSTDERVSRQMTDLHQYRPVSAMPAVVRDISIAVGVEEDEETLGDRVRDALGPAAGSVESLEVVSAAAYKELPASAVARLGLGPDQKNLLLRVVLRDLEQTLTDSDANALRDRIYAALHRGSATQWAT